MTTNSLQIFQHEQFGEIRTAGTWDNPLFCLADVCRALELPQVAKVVQRLDKEVLTTHPLQSAGGIQQMYFVNEDGLYDVVLDSRKPEAKKFRKWITSEVLPSIRKTGSYSVGQKQTAWLANRLAGKKTRKLETDCIKAFLDFHEERGHVVNPAQVYGTISAWCNIACGIDKRGGRDKATTIQLGKLAMLENFVGLICMDAVQKNLPYKKVLLKIYYHCLEVGASNGISQIRFEGTMRELKLPSRAD